MWTIQKLLFILVETIKIIEQRERERESEIL